MVDIPDFGDIPDQINGAPDGEIKINTSEIFNQPLNSTAYDTFIKTGDILSNGKETISIEEFNESLRGDLAKNPPQPPDFKRVMSFMFENTGDADLDLIQNTIEDDFRGSEAFTEAESLNTNIDNTRNAPPDPNSEEDFNKQRANSPNIDEKMSEVEEQIKEDVKSGKKTTAGKWVKTSLLLGFSALGVFSLYNLIKAHQNEMNGCWLINVNGDKCKIDKLTCDSAAKKAGNQICRECDLSKSSKDECFNPCKIENKIKNPVGFCCDEQMTGCTKNCSTQCAPDCNSGEGCVNCNCQIYSCPSNFSMRCVSVSFWDAALDICEDIFGYPILLFNTGIEGIKKVLIIGGIVIGVFAILYLLIQIFKKK